MIVAGEGVVAHVADSIAYIHLDGTHTIRSAGAGILSVQLAIGKLYGTVTTLGPNFRISASGLNDLRWYAERRSLSLMPLRAPGCAFRCALVTAIYKYRRLHLMQNGMPESEGRECKCFADIDSAVRWVLQ